MRIECGMKQHTHPTDILNEWMYNSVLEALFIELGPIDPHACILWEVMDTMVGELALVPKRGLESNVRREVWFAVRLILGGSEQGDVASRVTSNELQQRVNGGEKGVARTVEECQWEMTDKY